jgi:hypothetical protein
MMELEIITVEILENLLDKDNKEFALIYLIRNESNNTYFAGLEEEWTSQWYLAKHFTRIETSQATINHINNKEKTK